jgi:hypothetical protein
MKRPRPLPAGPVTDFVAKTQRTTSPAAQPNRVMFESRTMRTEAFMSAAVTQWLCAIKSKFEATSLGPVAAVAAKTKRRRNDDWGR